MYILNKFIQLKRVAKSQKDKEKILKAGKIIDYFAFSNAAFEIFKEFMNKWENDEKGADFKLQTAIFSMYTNGRICLEITQKINKNINGKYPKLKTAGMQA